jgi:hypothetical protein
MVPYKMSEGRQRGRGSRPGARATGPAGDLGGVLQKMKKTAEDYLGEA